MSCYSFVHGWDLPGKSQQKTKPLQTNFGPVTVQEKTVGVSYPISVTFVEVQLGSGGVLCVAQGTAQSHGKEGENQRVSAHQFHLKCCNLFLFWLGHVQNGASKKTGQTADSL